MPLRPAPPSRAPPILELLIRPATPVIQPHPPVDPPPVKVARTDSHPAEHAPATSSKVGPATSSMALNQVQQASTIPPELRLAKFFEKFPMPEGRPRSLSPHGMVHQQIHWHQRRPQPLQRHRQQLSHQLSHRRLTAQWRSSPPIPAAQMAKWRSSPPMSTAQTVESNQGC